MSDFLSKSATAATLPVTHPLPQEEGCPTPLAWQEVLDAVRQGARRHSIERGSVRVSATSFGEGTPFYLLPGFLGDHEQGVLTSWLLRDECCCVMVDPPHHTNRSRLSPTKRLGEWADAIAQLAQSLGHEHIRLHGPNFGGLIALRLMLDHPDRIASASLQCAFTRWKSTLAERCVAAAGRRSRRNLGQVRAVMRVQEINHSPWFPPFDQTRWEFFAGNIAATPVAEAALRAQVAAAVDLRDDLHRITQPILIVQSEGDGRASLSAQSELSAGLPRSQVEVLDNCGRLSHITHPHRLVKLLRTFWEQTP